MLKTRYEDNALVEIGVDEAGRGPMLGRVYSAAVVLPQDNFKHEDMKDSKRFHSEKKIREVAEYIKQNAIAWSVAYSSEQDIDEVNIRNATHNTMHKALHGVIKSHKSESDKNDYKIIVDGRDFKNFILYEEDTGIVQVPHVCVEGGDNKYTCIAAASILAKVARDDYIIDLCENNPILEENYGILKNKGYGTKQHMDGITKNGITKFHRKTFGICKNYS